MARPMAIKPMISIPWRACFLKRLRQSLPRFFAEVRLPNGLFQGYSLEIRVLFCFHDLRCCWRNHFCCSEPVRDGRIWPLYDASHPVTDRVRANQSSNLPTFQSINQVSTRKRYPTPGSVMIYWGRAGLRSSLWRRLLMLTRSMWTSFS